MDHLMKCCLIFVKRKERRKQKEKTERKEYEKKGYRKVHEFYF